MFKHDTSKTEVASRQVDQPIQKASPPALADKRTTRPEQTPLQRKPNTTGLPDNLKSGMESISGMSLDHVKVHYNSPKPAAVQAHAYAQGSDIHLASGQAHHLPHELGHVVQQAQGRVRANTHVGGATINDDPGLEAEATRMGHQALQRASSTKPVADYSGSFSQSSSSPIGNLPIQRWPDIMGGLSAMGNAVAGFFSTIGNGIRWLFGGGNNAQAQQNNIVAPAPVYPTTTRAGISQQLQDALNLAKANNPAIPPWLQQGERCPKIDPATGTGTYTPGQVDAHDPSDGAYNSKDRKTYGKKFGSTHNNNDGNLPGVTGAGGYLEYYAQPTPGPCNHHWGRNRILQQTNDPAGPFFWATSDHYTTVARVTDA